MYLADVAKKLATAGDISLVCESFRCFAGKKPLPGGPDAFLHRFIPEHPQQWFCGLLLRMFE